jgi:Domain of unknown function (DUF4287)/Domain of unknown function (DUF5655)
VTTVDAALQSQLRNIEMKTGRSVGEWVGLISASGRRRHGEIVPWLKAEHGLTHGSAHRLALVAIARLAAPTTSAESSPEDALYPESRGHLLPIHIALMGVVRAFGDDVEVAPKKGYLSLRRRKQFAMLQPAANHVDVGVILPGGASGVRLESAETFNALFSNRVRVHSIDDIDGELIGWLRAAYDAAG